MHAGQRVPTVSGTGWGQRSPRLARVSEVMATSRANNAPDAALLKRRIATLQADFLSLQSDHTSLQSDHATLNSEHATLESEHATLKSDHISLQSEHQKLNAESIRADAELADAEGRAKVAEAAADAASARCLDLENEVKNVRAAWAESQDALKRLSAQRQAAFGDRLAQVARLTRASGAATSRGAATMTRDSHNSPPLGAMSQPSARLPAVLPACDISDADQPSPTQPTNVTPLPPIGQSPSHPLRSPSPARSAPRTDQLRPASRISDADANGSGDSFFARLARGGPGSGSSNGSGSSWATSYLASSCNVSGSQTRRMSRRASRQSSRAAEPVSDEEVLPDPPEEVDEMDPFP